MGRVPSNPEGEGDNLLQYLAIFSFFLHFFAKNISMPFRKIKWPKSEEKPKFGVGGVCHGDAVSPMYRSRSPNVKLVVQPMSSWALTVLTKRKFMFP